MRLFALGLGRLTSAAMTLLAVSIAIFAAAHLLPGGYTSVVLGPLSSDAARQAAQHRFGLDESLPVQYWHWLSSVVTGDFGTSLVSRASVSHEIVSRLGVTAELGLLAAGIALAVGVPLGLLTALRAGEPRRSAVGRLAGGLGMGLPDFVLGSIVVYVFSRYALGLRVGGYVSLSDDVGDNLRSILLPALVLAVFATSAIARTTRDAVLGVLVEPHVTAAVARGESPAFIVRHHLLRNAAGPVVVVATTVAAQLLGGVVIVESLFDLPGLGSYLVHAVGVRDYAPVEACVLLAAAVFIATNMSVDIAAGIIDPRIGGRRQRR